MSADRTTEELLAYARHKAARFVAEEAGFAQVTTFGRGGRPVGRTMTAFLREDWSVDLIQRRTHRRVTQLQTDPRVLVTWVGTPADGSTNERPHVFDLGLLIPRVVYAQGTAELLDAPRTWRAYAAHTAALRAAGHTRAPLRTSEDVADELIGFRVRPARFRLEGFGVAAESFAWTPTYTDTRTDVTPPEDEVHQ